MKLKKIEIKNYKQLAHTEINLHDNLTILAGPNNSGKTTFISLLKGIFDDNKLRYTHHDIPIELSSKWKNIMFDACNQVFPHEGNPDSAIQDLFEKITKDGQIQDKYLIPSCEVQIEISYNPNADDIRNFAEYIMDLDEYKHAFYFRYVFSLSLSSFRKNLIKFYEKLNSRFVAYSDGKTNQETIKNMLINIYIQSLTEHCFYTDSNYQINNEIEIAEFKKLFHFKSITAIRTLDDLDTDSTRMLSKSIISLASKDNAWKDTSKTLPDKILSSIESDGINEKIKDLSANTLSTTLNALAETNGGHIGEIVLEMDISEDDVSDLLKRITCAKYQLDGHLLDESSQGLGFSNMIYLHMQLEEFEKSIDPLMVNIFIIEEPESHMHPQMQNVFIKHLLGTYKKVGMQGLVSTHSNEMVRVSGLEHLRVIREINKFSSKIFDLSSFRNKFSEKLKDAKDKDPSIDTTILENFFDWFFEIGFSEIIFADKAILYEGDTERLYLRKLITLPDYNSLSEQYIAFIQVGGAYAYNYKRLIDFIKIKTLIITDLDYPKDALTDDRILSSKSSNSTLNKFYKLSMGKSDELEEYKLEDDNNKQNAPTVSELYDWAYLGKHEISPNLIYVAFQDKQYKARTLEEAMLAKLLSQSVYKSQERSIWKEYKKSSKLNFSIPNNRDGEKDSLYSIRDIVRSTESRKTDFMYSVILNSKSSDMLPTYIKEGLEWLMKKDQ